jgi:hypothetical protein
MFFEFCLRCKFHPKCKNTPLKNNRNGSPALALCYEWQKKKTPNQQIKEAMISQLLLNI